MTCIDEREHYRRVDESIAKRDELVTTVAREHATEAVNAAASFCAGHDTDLSQPYQHGTCEKCGGKVHFRPCSCGFSMKLCDRCVGDIIAERMR